MNDKTILAVIAVVVAVEIILAAAFVTAFNGQEKESAEPTYTLYIGMNDSVTHEGYDPDVVAPDIDRIVMKYSSGLTRYSANGAWMGDSGEIDYEKNLIYTISGITLDDVKKICDEVKVMLNQSSIMISIFNDPAIFY